MRAVSEKKKTAKPVLCVPRVFVARQRDPFLVHTQSVLLLGFVFIFAAACPAVCVLVLLALCVQCRLDVASRAKSVRPLTLLFFGESHHDAADSLLCPLQVTTD